MAKPHLLLFGWYRPGTGFTRVLESLLPWLSLEFRVTWMGVGYQGEAFDWSPRVRVLPTNLRGGDLVGAYAAARDWDALRPDAVLALNDLWYLIHYTRALGGVRGRVPLVGYLPLDGKIPDPRLASELDGFSTLVTYTDSAARDLRDALARIGCSVPVVRAGHGVDLRRFHPLSPALAADACQQRMQRAQAHFGLPQPAFVVLNAARPDPRKRIDLTLTGFAEYARQSAPPIYLCLHQAIAHPQFVEPLRAQADALGIADRVIWQAGGTLSDQELNALYNACALGINTAVGEGFGLVSFEHAATGAPQIVPGQEALIELWGEAAYCLPVRPLRTEHSPLLMVETSGTAVATALADLHGNPDCWRALSQAGYQLTQSPALRWEPVAASLLDALRA